MFKQEECVGAYRNMGISSVPLGIGSREDGVHKHKGPYDLSSQSNACAVAIRESVGTTTILHVVGLLKGLHEPNTTDGSQALSHHVHHSPEQRHLASQEQPESHGRVNVTPCT